MGGGGKKRGIDSGKLKVPTNATNAAAAIGALTSDGIIKVTGVITIDQLTSIVSAINTYSHLVNLDLGDCTLPEGTDTLPYANGKGFFEGCAKLSEITLPKISGGGTVMLAANCFKDCANLTAIHGDFNAKRGSSGQINGCSALKSIVLPSDFSVMHDESAFNNIYFLGGCNSFKTVYYRGNSSDWSSHWGELYDFNNPFRDFTVVSTAEYDALTEAQKSANKYIICGYTGN